MMVTLLRPAAKQVRALLLIATTVAAGAAIPAGAQNRPAPTVLMGDLSRRDIRVPEGEPNISGTWINITPEARSLSPLDGGTTPFQPWARDYFEQYGRDERSGAPANDPNAGCIPSGLPRLFGVPFGFDIVQTPDKIFIAGEIMHIFRIIHMDGKPPPADYKPTYFGYSVGHWEGDDLVIETTGINGLTPVDEEGRPKSNRIRIVEHVRKVAPNLLENTYTIYDPVAFTRPYSSRSVYAWSPQARVNEYVCEENNRNNPDAGGVLRHR